MSSFFNQKVVWITGASSGLGEGLAIECAKEKSRLVLSARRGDELERVKKECLKYVEEQDVLTLPLDITTLNNVDIEVEKIRNHFGRIDILINNAGVVQRSYSIDTPIELERKMFEVNYFGAIVLSKAVLPIMQAQKSGNIVAISSVMGKMGFPGRSTYSASKHALHGYYESLRIEERINGINVHLVCPGYIKTNVSLNAINASGEKYNKMDKGQANGMEPWKAARKVMRAISKNRFETFFGGAELILLTVKRYLPSLYYRLILSTGKKKLF